MVSENSNPAISNDGEPPIPPEIPRLKETPNGTSLFYKGHHLYSSVAPIKSACRVARALCPTPQTLYFLPSPLLGYGVSECLRQADADSAFLLWEPEAPLQKLTREAVTRLAETDADYRRRQATGRLCLLTDASLSELSRLAFDLISRLRLRRITPIELSAGNAVYPAAYRAALTLLTGCLSDYWKNRSTKSFLSFLWYRNLLANLPAYRPNPPPELPELAEVAKLPEAPDSARRTLAVIGAGPTLDRFLPELISHRNRYRIFAVDSALPTLLSADLIPDFAVVLEAQHANFRAFYSVKPVADRITLIADLIADPKAVRLFPRRQWVSSSFSKEGLLNRVTETLPHLVRIPELGSVGIVALLAAIRFAESYHADAIVTAGLDFSAPRGKSHANASASHLRLLATHGRLNPIENRYAIAANETRLPLPGQCRPMPEPTGAGTAATGAGTAATAAGTAAGTEAGAEAGAEAATGSGTAKTKAAGTGAKAGAAPETQSRPLLQEEDTPFFASPLSLTYLKTATELAAGTSVPIVGPSRFTAFLPPQPLKQPKPAPVTLGTSTPATSAAPADSTPAASTPATETQLQPSAAQPQPNGQPQPPETQLQAEEGSSSALISVLEAEARQLRLLLQTSTGIEAFTRNGAPLAYLTETFVVGSKENNPNRLAGKIKLNGCRLLEKINQSVLLLRTDKKAL